VDGTAEWCHRADNDKEEKVLKNADKYQFLSEGTRQVLRICDIKPSDAGPYSCMISTADEPLNTTARLHVTGKRVCTGY